jgi:hypothetical protein
MLYVEMKGCGTLKIGGRESMEGGNHLQYGK